MRRRMSAFHPFADIQIALQTTEMGKRSGVPYGDDELEKLSCGELVSELDRLRMRLTIAGSTKMEKQWHKRIHWLEATLARRD